MQPALLIIQLNAKFLARRLCSIWDYGSFSTISSTGTQHVHHPYEYFWGAGTADISWETKIRGPDHHRELLRGNWKGSHTTHDGPSPGGLHRYGVCRFEHYVWCINGTRARENHLPMKKKTMIKFGSLLAEKNHLYCHPDLNENCLPFF